MIISHLKRFVIFAPWKTASQTLRLRLARYEESTYSPFFEFNPFLNRVVHQHLTCADYLALPEARLGYFKASFVRNPYDRAYSGFIQLQRDIAEQRTMTFPAGWIRDLVMAQLDEILAALTRAGFDFDTWWAAVPEYLIFEPGRSTNFLLHPAHYWTHVNKAPYVEFVGKVEQFEQDFTLLCRRLEIEDAATGNINVSSPPDAEAAKGPIRYASRMSRASISKINSLFREDFDLFGYDRLPE